MSAAQTQREMKPKPMPEYRLQEHIIAAARQLHWHVYHTYYAVRSQPGYPDITLVKDGRLIFAELKQDGKHPRTEQQVWLDALAEVPGCEVYIWRGADWESGEIARILTRQEDQS
jgi:hypothetical protein